VPARLARWRARPVTLQPCLRDIWHDHLLFAGDDISGIVDYGATCVDHRAVDLARLLGSLVADDFTARAGALNAYARLAPLTPEEWELTDALDETGTVLGVANWLLWLYHEDRLIEDRARAANRLGTLIERIEGWQCCGRVATML
jgi:Ser/Thr protein kinase RdoA (MazF antagonist)